MNKDIKRIVLTGGPCAGKTTALVKIMEHFSSLGYKVFTLPEVPTIFLQAGMDYLTKNEAWFFEGEADTLKTQLLIEDSFMRMAQTIDGPVLIVCDRGAMDISSYLTAGQWNRIMALCETDTEKLTDRYDAVLHMVSAADGAEKYYNTTTNEVRTEGLERARQLDHRVMEAWTGHPRLRVINNHDDFQSKIHRVIKEISSVLGLPQPVVEERKYIVRLTGHVPESNESEISQTYLVADPNCEVRLRRRSWAGKTVFVHTSKRRLPSGEEIETERQISSNLYQSLLQQADPYRQTIVKTRQSFIWHGQFFELDTFHAPHKGLQILETKGITEHEQVYFPPFVEVVEDITGDRRYYNYNLALDRQAPSSLNMVNSPRS